MNAKRPLVVCAQSRGAGRRCVRLGNEQRHEHQISADKNDTTQTQK